MEATRLRRDGDRRRPPRSPTSSRSRPTRPPCPASPTSRWPAWASTSSTPSTCTSCWRKTTPTPTRTTTSARTSSRARWPRAARWRIRSACRCVPTRRAASAALLARRRHDRCILGSQPRPGLDHPGARHLRHRLADLDLPAAAAAGQVRARPRRPARHDGQHPSSRAAASSRARNVSSSVLFSSVRVHSFCKINEAVLLPDVRGRPRLPAAPRW